MTSSELIAEQSSDEYCGEIIANTSDYRPTEGESTLKNVLDCLRFVSLRDTDKEDRSLGELIDIYWNTKPQIMDDPTGPLALAAAVDTVGHAETEEERIEIDEILLDGLEEVNNKVTQEPELASIVSLSIGIHAVDRMISAEHREHALTVVENILKSLEGTRAWTDSESGEIKTLIKIDPELYSAAKEGLREYREYIANNQEVSLEQLILREVQAKSQEAIHEYETQRAKVGKVVTCATVEVSDVPKLTREQYEEACDAYVECQMADRQRQFEWDTYYAKGGSPTEDLDRRMDPDGQNIAMEELSLDPDSTGALLRMQPQTNIA